MLLVGNHLSWALESTSVHLFVWSGGQEGSSWGNFTPPHHPPQTLRMKQGNPPETATASRIRAELRQEENAGWDTWGKKAKTATEHRRNTIGTPQQPPPSLRWQQLTKTKKSNTPRQQVRGDSQCLPLSLLQGKTPKRREKKGENEERNTGEQHSGKL